MSAKSLIDETLTHYPPLLLAEILVLITIFGLGFIWRYCVRLFLSVSDYVARRSTSSRRKRIESLEGTLTKYEADFSDQRLFLGRIVSRAVSAIAYLILGSLSMGLAFVVAIVHFAQCDLHNNCVYNNAFTKIWNYSWTSWELSAAHVAVIFTFLGIYAAIFYFINAQTLLLEISPEKYRVRFGDRIARLRDRMPGS
jgi:hypothetical protein